MSRAIIVVLVLLLSAGVVCAEVGKSEKTFWDGLRSKIEKVTPTKKTSVTTAVGGVRGARNEDDSELYWKGKEDVLAVSEGELTAFNEAMQTAIDGDKTRAAELFESFVAQYPMSELRQDSLHALENLKTDAE